MRVLVAVLLLLSQHAMAAEQEARASDERPRISVSGEALVNVRPDRIVITLGIETRDLDVTTAKRQNNEILKRTLAAARSLGVAEKDVQTGNLSIHPEWRGSYLKQEDFLGYVVRETLVITVADVAKVESLITNALQAGVNYIHGVDFQTTELKKHREQARAMALTAAKEKADKMAAVLAQKAGPPLQITESQAGAGYWSGWGSGRGGGMSQSVAQGPEGAGGAAGDTIALGTIAVRASVQVVFELRDIH